MFIDTIEILCVDARVNYLELMHASNNWGLRTLFIFRQMAAGTGQMQKWDILPRSKNGWVEIIC